MGPDVFDATVDTNILLLQNKIIYDGVMTFRSATIGADFDRQTCPISQYLTDNGVRMEIPAENEPWAILSSAELNLKRKIEDVGVPLKDWDINIYRGIITGCNEAFIIDKAKRKELIAQDPKSVEIIKPLLRGKDIKRYYARQSGFYILATDYDLDILNQYPTVFAYLEDIGKEIDSGRIKRKVKDCSIEMIKAKIGGISGLVLSTQNLIRKRLSGRKWRKKVNFTLIKTNSIRLTQLGY